MSVLVCEVEKRFSRFESLCDTHRCFLLLQGPNGPFFSALGKRLRARGAVTWKVNFNGGDKVFYRGENVLNYDGTIEAWSAWLGDCLAARDVDAVLLFGQSRRLHRDAIALCRTLGIAVYVFEEGYARPWWITMERDGVNERSALKHCDLRSLPGETATATATATPTSSRIAEVAQIRWRGAFLRMMCWTALYVFFSVLLQRRFPSYVHHWPLRIRDGRKWLCAWAKALCYRLTERETLRQLQDPLGPLFFLVPLQTHRDSQIRVASPWGRNERFIAGVMESFARHAAPSDRLVFKHHPLERGLTDYRHDVAAHARRLGIVSRISYVHHGNLPALLRRAKGVVLVNSTAGLQALYHGAPVCVTGEAFYAHPGLTSGGSMDAFWRAPVPPNPEYVRRFLAHMLHTTQINASFYACADVAPKKQAQRLADGSGRLGWHGRLRARPLAVGCVGLSAAFLGSSDALGALAEQLTLLTEAAEGVPALVWRIRQFIGL